MLTTGMISHTASGVTGNLATKQIGKKGKVLTDEFLFVLI